MCCKWCKQDDCTFKPHGSNSSALSVPKYQKLLQPQKNKLKIQSKRVLGCIKYTHGLADHNKVTQPNKIFS